MAEPARVENQPALVIETIPGQSAGEAPPLVLIHGWGCNSQIWGDFPAALINAFESVTHRDIQVVNLPGFGGSVLPNPFTLEKILAMFAEALPPRAVLVGWSLGGMIATAFSARYPGRVEKLICLGVNASYIQREGWTQAVPGENLAEFSRQLTENPARCIKRFRAQQVHGDAREKELLPALLRLAVEEVNSNWHTTLGLLADIDNRKALEQLDISTLYLFGERDSLVPVSVSSDLIKLNRRISTRVLAGAAHVLHLADQDMLAAIIRDFIEQGNVEQGAPLRDKRQVALSFSRSAGSYDRAAYLQRSTGKKLLEKLTPREVGNPLVLDLGCGTGHFLELLAEKLPEAQVLGLDLAEGMLEFTQQRPGLKRGQNLLCGDAEQLPIADNAVDLLFSNFCIQWCNDQEAVAREIHRILKPGGTALVSTLGPETLHQLRAAWHVVDGFVHVNHFQPLDALQRHFASLPFETVECQVETTRTEYPDLLLLLRELKALGARNLNQGRPTTLTGKDRLRKLAQAYEQFRPAPDKPLPASWQVIYLRVVKSAGQTA